MQESYKVLVVDDDVCVRALFERYLSEAGFRRSVPPRMRTMMDRAC